MDWDWIKIQASAWSSCPKWKVTVNLTVAMEDPYSDLLWALRGTGGGNFGVVTQFTYRIHRAWDELYLLTITLPSLVHDKAHGVTITANLMQHIGALEANDVLSRNVCIMYDGWDALHLIWSAADEVTFVQGRAYLQKLVNHRLGTAVAALPQQEMNIRWSDFYHLENIPVNKTSSWYTPVYKAGCWYGFLHPVNNTEAVWQEIMQHFEQAFRECPHLVPDVELWGGATKDPLPNATAFPRRSVIYNVDVLLFVNTDENDDEAEAIFQRESAAVNAWWHGVAQHLTGSYLNYSTASLGAEYPTAFLTMCFPFP